MTTRLRGPLLVSALGAAVLLLLTTERGSDEPRTPSPVAEVAKSQPPRVPESPPSKSEGSFPPAASAPAAPPPEPPRPLVLKTIDPPQKGGLAPELLPVAAAPQTPPEPLAPPPAATPTANPNSVFGWGPWTGGTPPSEPASSAPGGENRRAAGVDGLPRTVSSSSSGGSPAGSPPVVTPPPVVAPPPVTPASNVRPGHGFGDQNHTHIHRGK